jgi:hypothetical protein
LLLPSGALSQPREGRGASRIPELADIILRKEETAVMMATMANSTAATSETNAVADAVHGFATRTGFGAWRNFFIFFRRNPLKSPNSKKQIKGNESKFTFIYLHWLAFI